ncbi:MAG: hypothetical protein NZ954_00415 [Thermofilaceae archaeon]|nr:hypothetical protein [Thermofilaceae archaeon]MCX8180357.1 hypothetical protein [Thermofilaceae archaeon]MDW8003892.1 hypothetical protein [Thermofilaceae archaeon]
MKVDALLVVASTVLASTLLLHFYARNPHVYALSFECYAMAVEAASSAAWNLSTGGWRAVKPPHGWSVSLYFPDGRVYSKGTGGSRCYSYAIVNVNGTLLLVKARG